MKDRLFLFAFLAVILFAIWFDAHTPDIPDLVPAIERVMDWIDPAN